MKIHKAGYRLLINILISLTLINSLIYFNIDNALIFNIVFGVSCILYVLIVNFFRNPYREVIIDDNKIIAPADGKIVVIEETTEEEYLKDKRIQVSIFMNIFNVHINWFPVNGVVKYFKHHSGRFMAAYLPKSSTDNERTTIVVEKNDGTQVLFRQVAGAIARRIVSYVNEGDIVKQDKHAGFIKFGSRVDIYLPLGTKIDVKLGQKVTGSQTIIGTFSK